VHTAQ